MKQAADFILTRLAVEFSANVITGILQVETEQGSLELCTAENYSRCVDVGEYKVILSRSPKFSRKIPYKYFLNGLVPAFYNRKYPLSHGYRIHIGNDSRDTIGCILVGSGFRIESDSPFRTTGVVGSMDAYKELLKLLGKATMMPQYYTMVIREDENLYNNSSSELPICFRK